MQRNELAAAEAHFRRVLAVAPDNAASMNNVAMLLIRQRKPEALAFAEKAQAALPDNPEIMDTLASALTADKQLDKALEWQRKASEKRPGSPDIRFNLAKLLIATGNNQQARAELDKLATLGGRFASHAEVTALLKSL
jgi:cellulose synthase operon protein C